MHQLLKRAGLLSCLGLALSFSSTTQFPIRSMCRATAKDETPQSLLLVSLNADRLVAIIDVHTQKVIASVASTAGPHEITVARDRMRAYISDSGSGPEGSPGNSVVVLNLTTRALEKVIKTCDQPHDTRVSSDGRTLWVACAPMKSVQEIDISTATVRKTWATGLEGGWFVEVTPDDRKLYVPHLEGKALTVIDRRKGIVKKLISGTSQAGITISPNGRELWVSDAEENKLSVVDTSDDRIRTTVSLGAAAKGSSSFSRLLFTPAGEQVLVVRGSQFIVIDARRRSIVWTIDMPYRGKVLTASADSRLAFVSHPGDDRVSMINLSERRIERTFVVGKQPDGLAWVRN